MAWPLQRSDLRRALGFTESQGDNDDLDRYAKAAMERVEEMVGRCRGQVTTSTLIGAREIIVLDHVPASVAVTVDGVPASAFTPDLAAGILYGPFRGRVIQVTCTAPAEPPMIVQVSCEELAAIWYRQAKTGAMGQRTTWNPLGFAIPREIDEKLTPYAARKLPGIG